MTETIWMREHIRKCEFCGREYGHMVDHVTPSGFVAKVVRLHDCTESLMARIRWE